MTETASARVILVDPSSIFRDGMSSCLNQGGHLVVSEARNLEETLQQLELLQPGLALLGPNLTENETLAICREISCRRSSTKTIIITLYSQDALFRADAIYAGAAACLEPTISHEECLAAVLRVIAGQSLFQHSELSHGDLPIKLTQRERQVLKLLAEGKENTDIAHELGTSVVTIRNHAQHILEKLEVHSRQEAVRRARRRGWPV